MGLFSGPGTSSRCRRISTRCAESHDIGAYDTCLPAWLVHCYAAASRDRAIANFRRRDPDAARLLG
ncbi:MAG: hypothetical protein AB7H90_21795 [Alphaproteobacteria bacterium]